MNLQCASPCLLPLPQGDRERLILQQMKLKWANSASLFLFGYFLQSCLETIVIAADSST